MLERIIITVLLVFNAALIQAQCSIYEIPLDERIDAASTIIEGKVVSQYSFWDEAGKKILTSNAIEVYKVFKGQSSESVIAITEGGIVGD
nr:hypothetical protein [Bacteroidota bacterium]